MNIVQAKLKSMFSAIILDCQTRTTNPSCEDCIAYPACKAREAKSDKALGI